MSLWLKRLVLTAAIAVMPLQGVAAAMSVLLCHGNAQAHAMHESVGHDHGPNQDIRHDNGEIGAGDYHLCCHFTVTALPLFTLPMTLPEFTVRAFVPDSLHNLFFPDQPQRPPLA